MQSLFPPTINKRPERKWIALGLGCVVITEVPSQVRTVLGSCVAVIFHVPRLQISALCHAQLPEKLTEHPCYESCPIPCYKESPDSDAFKYVTCSIRYMLDELHRRGVCRGEIVTTLVGGANVVRSIDRSWSVADRNVAVARTMLENEGMVVAYADVGGIRGRVIEHLSDVNGTEVKYHDTAF
jgi:chemotaxis protein CheD